jgi:ribosomal protein S18 acetylase RimI-like enzyme
MRPGGAVCEPADGRWQSSRIDVLLLVDVAGPNVAAMSLHLRPITTDEMATWLVDHHRGYFESRVASGEPAFIAEANAVESMARLFPNGMPAKGHDIFVLVETDDEPTDTTAGGAEASATNENGAGSAVVGSLWIGPYPDEREHAMWVWSVALDEEYRGRGLGKAAMLLAEDEARRRGATEIGLNVFGFNDVAIGLYRSLGYETSSVQMRKILP